MPDSMISETQLQPSRKRQRSNSEPPLNFAIQTSEDQVKVCYSYCPGQFARSDKACSLLMQAIDEAQIQDTYLPQAKFPQISRFGENIPSSSQALRPSSAQVLPGPSSVLEQQLLPDAGILRPSPFRLSSLQIPPQQVSTELLNLEQLLQSQTSGSIPGQQPAADLSNLISSLAGQHVNIQQSQISDIVQEICNPQSLLYMATMLWDISDKYSEMSARCQQQINEIRKFQSEVETRYNEVRSQLANIQQLLQLSQRARGQQGTEQDQSIQQLIQFLVRRLQGGR
eukprot:TRINITY_DN2990_c0_g3_i1.p1 TRINITY_DN2990_c0_g3~~TRINITY_DN2990_c0_g3_i1.p1  ORF type:complete len:284 (-),score=22.09 TRINITY_DN2990_c0_g3_i1:429-1280(-)